MKYQGIPRVVSKRLIPLILLFAFYVQFHGDFGPGGGFQAGVIFAVAFILYGLIFGLNAVQKIAPPVWIEKFVALGVLLYAGTGFVGIFLGGNFLDYGVFDAHDPAHGQHLGILFVELGVGIAVASAMMLIFYAFAGRRRTK